MMEYKEPLVSFLVLDFGKEPETRLLLESLKEHVKFPYKVIYMHNGNSETYPYKFFQEGLIDHFIQTKENFGLGLGTREVFAASFSPYSAYIQNDQVLGRDFTQKELDDIIDTLCIMDEPQIQSVGLAGDTCQGKYSERAHITSTRFYRDMERGEFCFDYGDHIKDEMPNGGAGPYHDQPWREGAIQKLYEDEGFIHHIWPKPLFIDNGQRAVRQNPDGSKWIHFPDTKNLFLVKGPVKEKYVYPKLSDIEWESVLKTQNWPPGKIPENEVKDSFHVWH